MLQILNATILTNQVEVAEATAESRTSSAGSEVSFESGENTGNGSMTL